MKKLQLLFLSFILLMFSLSCSNQKEAKSIYSETKGLVIMQFESAPLSEGWVLETSYTGYTGEGYYRWDGKDHFKEATHGLLSFKFQINQPGLYHFKMRSYHDHEDTSLENDVWTRIDGKEWKKTFCTPNKKWDWMTKYDFGGYKPHATFYLGKGVHTLEFAGRSKNFCIDQVQLYLEGTDWKADENLPESTKIKKGNYAPVVSAGVDRNLVLPQQSLDLAANTEDTGGQIVSFEWIQIAGPPCAIKYENTQKPVLSELQQGTYQFMVTVTDNSGGTASDVVKITVYPTEQVSFSQKYTLQNGEVTFEAESVQVIGNWKIEKGDKGYNGEGYLVWRGKNFFDEPHIGEQLAYPITIDEDGEYTIRTYNRHDHEHSDQENDTWARFNDGPWVKFYSMKNKEWTWETSFADFDGFWTLDKGLHTLFLSPRSFGHKIDQIHCFKKGKYETTVSNRTE